MELQNELLELYKRKQDLIERGIQIRNQLIKFDTVLKNNERCGINDTVKPTTLPRQSISNLSQDNKSLKKNIAATRKVTGIVFQNIKKTWLKNCIWHYEMIIVLKIIKCQINLTIDKENVKKNEILDIKCDFIDIDQYCLQEISSCIAPLIASKNFNNLMSAFSEYNDQSILRIKILNKLKSKNIVTVENSESGGLITIVHCPRNPSKLYIKFHWRLQLNTQTTSIDHIIDVDGLDNEFVKANEMLLRRFCKSDLKKNELEKLWGDLCIIINEYKQ